MDDPKSEAIKLEMAKTRLRIADKLETLEEQVVEPTAVAVSDTVAKVKEAVDSTAEAVQSTVHKVQETFDLAAKVRKHPYQIMAAGVASGFLLAHLLKKTSSGARPQISEASPVKRGERLASGHGSGNGVPKFMTGVDSYKPKSDHATLGHWARELSDAVMQSLTPVWKGLFSAAFAELLHPAAPQSPESSQRAEGFARKDWTSPDTQPAPEWGGRLRSTP